MAQLNGLLSLSKSEAEVPANMHLRLNMEDLWRLYQDAEAKLRRIALDYDYDRNKQNETTGDIVRDFIQSFAI